MFAEPTIDDFQANLRGHLDKATDRAKRAVRQIKSEHGARHLNSGRTVIRTYDAVKNEFDAGVNAALGELKRAFLKTKLDHGELWRVTEQYLAQFNAEFNKIIKTKTNRMRGAAALNLTPFNDDLSFKVRQFKVGKFDPLEPEVSQKAQVPEKSEVPQKAEVPQKSEVPEKSEVPQKAEVPQKSEVPKKSEVPQKAEVPQESNAINMGSMTGSTIQQGSPNAQQNVRFTLNINSAQMALLNFETEISKLTLSELTRTDINADLHTIRAQLSKSSPTLSIIQECGRTIRDVIEGNTAGALTPSVIAAGKALWSALGVE